MNHMSSYTTEEFAALVRVRPSTLREAFCRAGHWAGVRPVKVTRRLLWPKNQVDAVLRGEPLPNESK